MANLRFRPPQSPAARSALIVGGALAVGAAVLLVPQGAPQALVYDALSIAAALVGWAAAARLTGVDRRIAALVAAACAMFAIGNVVWDVYEVVLSRPVPETSIADIAYVSGYPFLLSAAIMLVRHRTAFSWVSAVLDAVIVATAVGLLVWEPILIRASTNSWEAFVVGAYPVGDIAIIALLGVTIGLRRATMPVWVLLAGILLNAVADFGYLIAIGRDAYASGGWLDAIFIASPLIMAAAPFAHTGRHPFSASVGSLRDERPVVATAVVCVALVALPLDFATALGDDPGASGLAVRFWLRFMLLGLVALRLMRQSEQLTTTAATLRSTNRDLSATALRLGSVMDATDDAVFYVDTEGRLLESNPAAAEMFDLPSDLPPGTLLGDHMAADTVARLREALGTESFEAREAVIPLRARGRFTQIALRATTVRDMGVAQGVVIVARDITEHVLAQIAASSFTELDPCAAIGVLARPLRDMVDFQMISLSVVEADAVRELARARVDRDGNVTDEPTQQLVSRRAADLLQRTFRDTAVHLLHADPEDPAPYFADNGLEAALLVFLRDAPSERISGILTLGFAAGTVDPESTEVLGVLAPSIARALDNMRRYDDERRAKERLRDIDALRDGFLGMVVHEVRSPLGVISFAADVVNDHVVAAGLTHTAGMAAGIAQSARQLDRLIGDLVDVGRGEFRCTPTRLDSPHRLIADAATAAAGDARRLTVNVLELPPIDADADRITQVITNLVSNAVKFSGPDDPVVVTAEPIRSGRAIRIDVFDRGVGVPPEQAHLLFQRFSRLGTRVHGEEIDGMGLGLYISQQIVAAHDGEIRFAPNADAGSTFTVELPAALSSPR